MDDINVEALSAIFRVPGERIKEIIEEGEDLYDKISEDTGLSRGEVKRWAHGVMYSVEGEGFPL